MLCPRPKPLNRRATVLTLLGPHQAHPPAQRVRSPAPSRHSRVGWRFPKPAIRSA